jgi:hypothetical protein
MDPLRWAVVVGAGSLVAVASYVGWELYHAPKDCEEAIAQNFRFGHTRRQKELCQAFCRALTNGQDCDALQFPQALRNLRDFQNLAWGTIPDTGGEELKTELGVEHLKEEWVENLRKTLFVNFTWWAQHVANEKVIFPKVIVVSADSYVLQSFVLCETTTPPFLPRTAREREKLRASLLGYSFIVLHLVVKIRRETMPYHLDLDDFSGREGDRGPAFVHMIPCFLFRKNGEDARPWRIALWDANCPGLAPLCAYHRDAGTLDRIRRKVQDVTGITDLPAPVVSWEGRCIGVHDFVFPQICYRELCVALIATALLDESSQKAQSGEEVYQRLKNTAIDLQALYRIKAKEIAFSVIHNSGRVSQRDVPIVRKILLEALGLPDRSLSSSPSAGPSSLPRRPSSSESSEGFLSSGDET